ncbi:MAG: ABC transporter ATP-binding protein, partial [Mycolicibacterium sp.]|nr:ABC transporter ATP-binding protein [Mycolicibacterium sp.]
MERVVNEPLNHGLRSAPAIAPPPPRRRRGSDLRRLLPYLLPYRARWISMVLVAVASLVATVAIPLMTKAVIDGPVRHQDQRGLWVLGAAAMGVGVSE